jgi:hypothetical protein
VVVIVSNIFEWLKLHRDHTADEISPVFPWRNNFYLILSNDSHFLTFAWVIYNKHWLSLSFFFLTLFTFLFFHELWVFRRLGSTVNIFSCKKEGGIDIFT